MERDRKKRVEKGDGDTNIIADEDCVTVDAADTGAATGINKEASNHLLTASVGIGDESVLPAPLPDGDAEGLKDL